MRVIGYTSEAINGKVRISESTGESCRTSNIDDILRFLIEPFEDEHFKLVWELATFAAPIFRLLPPGDLEKLAKTKKIRIGNYGLFYAPDKVMSITYGRWKSNIYELQQYFPAIEAPKNSLDVSARGAGFLRELKKIGFNLTGEDKLTSPAKVLETWLLDHLDLPTDQDIPEEKDNINAYAYWCRGRTWISAIKIGHWQRGQIWDYDLSGAYTHEASQLYDFRQARIDYSQSPVIGAHWGFLRGRVTIDCPLSPIMRRMEDDTMANPVGEWDDILTLDEVRFIKRYGIGKFHMKDGWFITQQGFDKPLEVVIARLYRLRKQRPTLDLFLKRAANGCFYGKFLEMHNDGPARHFNPIYAVTVSTRTRLKVGAFILDNNLVNDTVHVGTDGVLVTQKVELPADQGLGKWRMSEPDGVLVASSGQVFSKTPTRQTKPKGITYDDFMRMVAEHPRLQRYNINIPRKVTLREAASRHYDELGNTRDFHSSIDFFLQEHTDRHFKKLPRTGETLLNRIYESEAIRL